MTAQTLAAVESCMLGWFIARLIEPLVHVDATILQTLELEIRLVVRVEGRKPVIARRTMEEHHVAELSLGFKHLP